MFMKKFILLILAFFCISWQIYAQKTVNGVVTGADGNGIPGVTVQVVGTSLATITNAEGGYTIDVPEDSNVLLFSYIGMKTQEVEVSSDVVNIVMEIGDTALEEVVVVGYGTQIKRNLTGSIVKVETDGLKDTPVNSFESAIQGQTSGVFIEKTSGKLGEGIKMRIRGASSISADNQPLYVVDGMPITSDDQGNADNHPTNPLADLNMNDIESIQILKDASAAAIYGSRASNGVVVITTKKGKSGKTNFNFDISHGWSKPSILRDWLNAAEYTELFDEALNNVTDPNTGLIWDWLTPTEMKDRYIPGWDEGNDVDWQDLAFQNAQVTNVNLSARGGSEKTTFYTGISYNKEDGILVNNDFQRISGRLNINHKASKYVELGMNMSLTRTILNRVANDNAFATPLQLTALPSVQAAYDETGKPSTRTVYYNGLRSVEGSNEKQKVFRTLGNVYAQINIIEGLKFRNEFGLDILNQRESAFYGRNTIGAGPAGEGQDRTVNVLNYNTNNYFAYNKNFEDKHDIQVTLGMAYNKTETDFNNIYVAQFPSDDLQTLVNGTEAQTFTSARTEASYLSYFGRANYTLMDRYLFSVSARADGSSKFGRNNRYGVFPAGSAGWIISNESFMENLKFISFLKARFSIGVTGNSGIGNFDHLGLYRGADYAGTPGLRPTQLENPDLKWEKTTQYNIGLDFGLFKNRINGEVDYYMKKTNDLLLNRVLPATSGYTSITENVGELENKGFEFSINTVNLAGEFKWSTNINFSFNRNKVTKLNGTDIIAGVNRVKEGHPIGIFEIVKFAGVDSDNGDALFYIDENSDATTNAYGEAHPQVVGSPNPKFVGGFTNSFSYKGFDLKIITNFVYGNKIYNGGGTYQSSNCNWWDNQTTDQLDRWQQQGDITDVPQARFGEANGNQESTRYLSDGSYLRIKNITFGYNLPANICKRIHFSSIRVFVTAINLYTFTNYNGWDPEVNTQGTDRSTQNLNIVQGSDFYTVPQARTISIGINLGF